MSSSKKTLAGAVLALLVIAVVLCLYYLFQGGDSTSELTAETIPRPGAALIAREKAADETVWAKEMLAQSCGRTVEDLWDAVNAATNKFTVLAQFPVGEVLLPQWITATLLPHNIELRQPTGAPLALTSEEWRQRVTDFARQGWQLENMEFRHVRFEADEQLQPVRSHFEFSANLTHLERQERAAVGGHLIVEWAVKTRADGPWLVKRIDATRLTVKTRRGEPPFKPILAEQITPLPDTPYIDPLIVDDLDGNGFSEIILAAQNRIYQRNAEGSYHAAELCRHPPGPISSALLADFDQDGSADFLCAKAEGLVLYKGSRKTQFDEPGILVWSASQPLRNVSALTCVDIDHDGDLDLFLAQYRIPTLGQVLRPFYYDASDGWPAYLLLNSGDGTLTDATESAGLGQKRWRRTYSASFAALDDDEHPDLAVVSDFAGLDLYRNDGQGHFAEVTRQWVAESHAFGMAHALADFNVDGRLDLLMIGMPSPAVDRLEHLGLSRSYSPDDSRMRPAMAYGNRLYLGRQGGGFGQTPLNDSIARSGWSWGSGAFDFDNDSFPDVYIANGLQTKQSVRDYEPEFWLHDIFVDESFDDLTASGYFLEKFDRTRGSGWSYGGYEKNSLYLNRGAESFLEIGHLAGVALEQDCRNVVADDLDADGRMDLLVTTLEEWPEKKQTLRVFQNALPGTGHWIGFRFRQESGSLSPIGVRVALYWDGRAAVRQLVTGDSHRSQHPQTIHFGLGTATRVERAEFRWTNGQVVTLHHPAPDRYHEIRSPARGSGPK